MLRKFTLLVCCFQFFACAELQQIASQAPQGSVLNNTDIASGLKQALNFGIEKQVSKLTQEDGFFKNELVKILLPEELKKVDKTLRGIGLGKLADSGLKILNSAAEDAVKEATPIFVNAVKDMTFDDAKNILLGEKNAATQYLEAKTSTALYKKFNPVIENSLNKVGANAIWNTIIERYNAIPLTKAVNPNLTDYVTQEALNGVYTMIAVEENNIRSNVASRTTNLLRSVFALQDKK